MVLGEYPMSWLVDRFFQDTLGIPWQAIVRVLPETWVGRGRWTVKEVEKQITQVLYSLVDIMVRLISNRNTFCSPPRISSKSRGGIYLDGEERW